MRCGELARRMDVEKEKFPPTIPLHKGTAVHAGAEINFKQKITSFADLSASKIREATAAAFEQRVSAEGFQMTREEDSIGSGIVLGRAKDRAIILTDIYTAQVAPQHQPIMVETYQRLKLKENLDLVVKLDFVNILKQIVDVKTGKRSIPQADADNDLQFSIYDLAFRAINGEPPAGIVVEQLVDAPKNPKRNLINTQRTEKQLQRAIKDINDYLFAMEKGIFLPAPKGSWWCSEDTCPAARTCKYFEFYQRGGGNVAEPSWKRKWLANKAAKAKEKKSNA